jgi:hypothetical protein
MEGLLGLPNAGESDENDKSNESAFQEESDEYDSSKESDVV